MANEVVTATDEQCAVLCNSFRNILGEAALSKEQLQIVLEDSLEELLADLVKVVRGYMKKTEMFVCRVSVDRFLKPEEMMMATFRNRTFTDRAVLNSMPPGENGPIDVYIFKPRPGAYTRNRMSYDEVMQQYDLRGLKPDPRAHAAFIQGHGTVARMNIRTVSIWQNQDGAYCELDFYDDPEEADDNDYDRCVSVSRPSRGYWWLNSEAWLVGVLK